MRRPAGVYAGVTPFGWRRKPRSRRATSKLGFYTYRPAAEYPVERSRRSKKGEVIGEFSLLVANATLGHGYIVTTASSL